MLKGKVKIFKEDKGFGFIVNSDTATEIFVHISGLTDQVNKVAAGDLVSYEAIEGRKGPNAVNVRKI